MVALGAGQVAIALASHQAGVAVAVPTGDTHHRALQEGHARQAGEQGLQGREHGEAGPAGGCKQTQEEDLSAVGHSSKALTSRQQHCAGGAGYTVKQGLQGTTKEAGQQGLQAASKQAAEQQLEGNNEDNCCQGGFCMALEAGRRHRLQGKEDC